MLTFSCALPTAAPALPGTLNFPYMNLKGFGSEFVFPFLLYFTNVGSLRKRFSINLFHYLLNIFPALFLHPYCLQMLQYPHIFIFRWFQFFLLSLNAYKGMDVAVCSTHISMVSTVKQKSTVVLLVVMVIGHKLYHLNLQLRFSIALWAGMILSMCPHSRCAPESQADLM